MPSKGDAGTRSFFTSAQLRARAAHARELANGILDIHGADRIRDFAMELDEMADALERLERSADATNGRDRRRD